MLDDRNRQLAEVTQVDDVIVSDQVISLLLTQISENRHLADVFADLFDAEGSELYLRPAEHYVQPGERDELPHASSRRPAAAARSRSATATAADAGNAEASFGIRVNPAKSASVEVEREDRVIVLAAQ